MSDNLSYYDKATSKALGRISAHLKLTDLTPLKPGNGFKRNKAGRVVLRGKKGGQLVKIYEAANPQHANFIRSLSNTGNFDGLLPKVMYVHGSFVIAEWVIEGGDTEVFPEDLAYALFRFHQVGKPSEAPGFDYWHDFICPRFLRAAARLGQSKVALEICSGVAEAWRASHTLMHPDLTLVNVVRTPEKKICVVDNELVTVGGLPLLDLCNTIYRLPPEHRLAVTKAYFYFTGRESSSLDFRALEGAWLARSVGSAYVADNLDLASKLVRQFQSGESVLPRCFEVHMGSMYEAEAKVEGL